MQNMYQRNFKSENWSWH